MTNRRIFTVATTAVVIGLVALASAAPLPMRLTDQEFWKLSSDSSEPSAPFHSENLVSNEIRFQTIVPSLIKTAVPGKAYLGVGSEQNFTYIAATRPAIAFIVDIRRGNLDLHLIYKVLFEMSADRVDFVSRVFSRPKPAGLPPASTAAAIFAAYRRAAPSPALYDQNLKEIKAALTTKHGFQLSTSDLQGIDFVYKSWFRSGPDIRYEVTTGAAGAYFPTYAELMSATDNDGKNRSYLASEDTFKIVKDLHARNMIVPVVGNFGGPKAIRAVANFLKQKEATVSVFYTSNVEQYLREDRIWGNFCASSATLPLDTSSVFLRTRREGFANQQAAPGANGNFVLELSLMKTELTNCAAAR
jgi:hypothetical protein